MLTGTMSFDRSEHWCCCSQSKCRFRVHLCARNDSADFLIRTTATASATATTAASTTAAAPATAAVTGSSAAESVAPRLYMDDEDLIVGEELALYSMDEKEP